MIGLFKVYTRPYSFLAMIFGSPFVVN